MFLVIFLVLCLLVFIFDLKERRIPNFILFMVLILKVFSMILYFDFVSVFDSVFAGIFALFVFLIPKFIGMKIGWGDIKYSAVLGFWLGFVDYIFGMLLSVIFIFIFCFVRGLMKKNIKDFPLPLGSFMSLGTVFICFFDIILKTLHL